MLVRSSSLIVAAGIVASASGCIFLYEEIGPGVGAQGGAGAGAGPAGVGGSGAGVGAGEIGGGGGDGAGGAGGANFCPGLEGGEVTVTALTDPGHAITTSGDTVFVVLDGVTDQFRIASYSESLMVGISTMPANGEPDGLGLISYSDAGLQALFTTAYGVYECEFATTASCTLFSNSGLLGGVGHCGSNDFVAVRAGDGADLVQFGITGNAPTPIFAAERGIGHDLDYVAGRMTGTVAWTVTDPGAVYRLTFGGDDMPDVMAFTGAVGGVAIASDRTVYVRAPGNDMGSLALHRWVVGEGTTTKIGDVRSPSTAAALVALADTKGIVYATGLDPTEDTPTVFRCVTSSPTDGGGCQPCIPMPNGATVVGGRGSDVLLHCSEIRGLEVEPSSGDVYFTCATGDQAEYLRRWRLPPQP